MVIVIIAWIIFVVLAILAAWRGGIWLWGAAVVFLIAAGILTFMYVLAPKVDVNTPRPSAPGSVQIVPVESFDGHTYFDACNSVDLDPSITALKNNGQVVPNAFSFLDKNEDQIAAGDYWFIDVPANVYGHIFFPVTGLTYQVRGPTKLMVGAATFWCDNGGSTSHDGMYQMVDAKRLDEMLLDSFWELAGDGAIGAWVNVPGVEAQPK